MSDAQQTEALCEKCPQCDGTGELESALHCEKCDKCNGTGKTYTPGEVYRYPGMVCGKCGCADLMYEPAASVPEDEPPCPVCGDTERSHAGYLLCECPAASLKPAPWPCPGIDTRAEAWDAWRQEWDRTHSYKPADGDAFDAGYRAAWKAALGVTVLAEPSSKGGA